MSSRDYWEKRKASEMFRYMEQAEKKADEISSLYLKSSRYLSLEMDEIFERFQKKHRLSESEARRLLSTLHDKTSIEELKAALRADRSDQTKTELLAELESAAYQARIERLRQLQNQLDLTMQQVYEQEKVINHNFYLDLGNEAYYRSIFDIQQMAGIGFSFNVIEPKLIERVINSRWSGANYSERIWSNTNALARDLKEELLINLMTGRTDREASEIIDNKFAVGASKARRLVRTESCNLATQMDMAGYEECGIETYIFVATLDLKTSKVCRKLDGKRFPVSEQQPGKNCPPMHPWCRSTTICDISDDELSQMKRRARDPVTGKTFTVSGNMTYEKWYDEYVKGKPEAELNEKMIKNRSADQKQYERYKKVLGNDIPKTLDSFQEMKYTDSDKWGSLKQGYQDTNRYQKIVEEAGNLNIKGQPIKRIERIDLSGYAFKEEHINIDREHQVTKELAQKYVNESVAAYRRWDGDVTVYVSPSGAAVVNHKEKTISTAYSAEEYDDKFKRLLEVLKIGELSAGKQRD